MALVSQPAHLEPSTARQRILKNAISRLGKSERELAEKYCPSGEDASLEIDKVFKACKEKQRVCEEKQWSIDIGGKKILLREKAGRILEWLEKVKQVGDIAVNADPVHAGLPWAGVRVILEFATSEHTLMEFIVVGMEAVLYSKTRVNIYLKLLDKGQSSKENDALEDSLSIYHARILKFPVNTIAIFEQSTPRRFFNSPTAIQDIKDFESDCDKLANKVERDAQNCDRWTRKLFNSDIKDQLRRLEELRIISSDVRLIWKLLDMGERNKILQWISQIRYEDNHNNARDGRTPETAEWIFAREEYCGWKESPRSMILWLHGMPGAGKTKLTSSVIDRLLKPSGVGTFAYFYCKHDDEPRTQAVNVLRSFIKQLSFAQEDSTLRQTVIKAYQEKEKGGFTSIDITYKESEDILLELIQELSKTILVLDALDECPKDERKKILQTFNHYVNIVPTVKIFISSRTYDSIEHYLSQKVEVNIRSEDNQNDIVKFIDVTIKEKLMDRSSPLSDKLCERIRQTLLEKAEGMFQWVYLQIQTLFDFDLEDDIEKYLGHLPDDLVKTYDYIFDQISAKKDGSYNIAIRTFQWVLKSVAPLESDALVAAVCQDPKAQGVALPSAEIDIKLILKLCLNLIKMNEIESATKFERSKICQVSHFSVREYLKDKQRQMIDGSGRVICSTYFRLLSEPLTWKFSDDSAESNIDPSLNTLWQYAATFWPDQILSESSNGRMSDIDPTLRNFIIHGDTTTLAYQNWYKWIYFTQKHPRRRTSLLLRGLEEHCRYFISTGINFFQEPLVPICCLGLHQFLPELFQRSSPADLSERLRQGSIGSLAVRYDRVQTVNSIFSHGIGPESLLDHKSRHPLNLAVRDGSADLVELLLDQKPTPNTTHETLCSAALPAAIYERDTPNSVIIKLLLDRGAKVNMHLNSRLGSALAAAVVVYGASTDIVELLLNRGAEVNMHPNSEYGSALAAAATATTLAARRAGTDIVELLLNRGAEVNMQLTGIFGSALAAAAGKGSINIVKLLLNRGAEVNMHLNGGYGSALAAAAWRGSTDIVELLLNRGAEVNMQLNGIYGSALVAAVTAYARDDCKVVELLLEKDANVNARLTNELGNMEKMISFEPAPAVVWRRERFVRCSIKLGKKPRSAIGVAALVGNHTAVKSFLENGARINEQLEDDIGSPLALAAYGGSLDTVQLLIDKGAKVKEKLSGPFSSALEAARNGKVDAAEIYEGKQFREPPDYDGIIRLLLDNGAEDD